ncbi:MAG TPA: hypothetical protein DET40_22110 [Lentisphaeria bacterium]|nr:MAG: hypothetical protein A2X45_04200 [Lentisphaerae bacterium GWF2_50_93]HCE46249.1 hypothetical protein [Lentisphaeria bacterium]
MKNFCLAFIFSVGMLFLSGCFSFDESIYEYHPQVSAVDKPLADNCYVMPILDIRPAAQRDLSYNISDDPYVSYIPLWPYSKSEINPLMKYDYFRPDLQDMLQILIARDLRFSGIFQNVKPVRFDESSEKPVFGYVVKIWINEAVWNRYLTTYGLAFPGTMLWSLGLPMSYGSVSMEIEADLIDAQTKNSIAKGKFRAETSCTEFLFDQMDYTPSVAEAKLCEIFPKIASQLRAFVLKNITEKK